MLNIYTKCVLSILCLVFGQWGSAVSAQLAVEPRYNCDERIEDVAGTYGANWGPIICNAKGAGLECKYGNDAEWSLHLRFRSKENKLVGEWDHNGVRGDQRKGPVEFDLNEQCQIKGGKYGYKGGKPMSPWHVHSHNGKPLKKAVAAATTDCDVGARDDRLSREVKELAAIGQKLSRYINMPLREPYEPDLPSICIEGDTATLKAQSFSRSISDLADSITIFVSFVGGGAKVFGFEAPQPASVDLAAFATSVVGLAKTEILRKKDLSLPAEEGLKEYGRLRKIQKDAEKAAMEARRRHICVVKRGVPEFYRRYHALVDQLTALRANAKGCGVDKPTTRLGRLINIYRWHAEGVFTDRRGANAKIDRSTGWNARRTWLEQGYYGSGRPPILNSVICR